MTRVLTQLAILLAVLIVAKLTRTLGHGPLVDRFRFRNLLPFFLVPFIWQLCHNWSFPWAAYLMIGWMLLAIIATCYLAITRGEILWQRFLAIFLRVSSLYLSVGYIATIIVSPWLR